MSKPGSKLTKESKTRMINIMNYRDSTHQYFWQMKEKYKLSESRIRYIYNQGILLEKAGKLSREPELDQFQCVHCDGIFDIGWSDEEAVKELNTNFPNIPVEECVSVCDDCYDLIKNLYKKKGEIV